MKVRIEIGADDSNAIFSELKSDIAKGNVFGLESGVYAQVVPQPSRHALPGPDALVFMIEFSTGVGAGLIANWLYDKLRDKGVTLRVGKEEIRLENADKLKGVIIEASVQVGTSKSSIRLDSSSRDSSPDTGEQQVGCSEATDPSDKC